MFLLILAWKEAKNMEETNLHSTMFLLIPAGALLGATTAIVFTFHNVSINSSAEESLALNFVEFTFHTVSINSTGGRLLPETEAVFTFHNVSINSRLLLASSNQ